MEQTQIWRGRRGSVIATFQGQFVRDLRRREAGAESKPMERVDASREMRRFLFVSSFKPTKRGGLTGLFHVEQ